MEHHSYSRVSQIMTVLYFFFTIASASGIKVRNLHHPAGVLKSPGAVYDPSQVHREHMLSNVTLNPMNPAQDARTRLKTNAIR